LVIPNQWAIEVKLARPYGDNGLLAEHWSENILHPYPGNVSAIGDALKLASMPPEMSKAVVIYAFEHAQPLLDLEPAIRGFELLCETVAGVPLGRRVEATTTGLMHPVHSVLRVFGWELIPRD
jgi:hypothetical protein